MRPWRFALATLWLACSSNDGPVSLAPSIVFPEGILDGVTRLTVSVYDGSGSLDCNAKDGTVSGLGGDKPLATKDLGSSNCPNGAKFCGDIQIDKSGSPRLFAAQAFTGTSSAPVASGCTKMPDANQDNLAVKITMLRTLPQQTCNGKPSSMVVQCTTGPDGVCDANCQSVEVYFSKGDNTSTSDTKAKVRPMLVWPNGTGDSGRLVGVWGDRSPSGGTEISMRVFADDMNPYTTQGQYVQDNSFRVPGVQNGGLPPPGYPLPQFDPTIASINGDYYVAFEDGTSGPTAIKIRSLDPILNPQQASAVAVSDNSAVAQALPSMAANGNNMFVAWENNGTIVGKTVAAGGLTLGTQKTFGPGTSVSVAATASGWVAVWQNGTDVQMATIDSTGTPGPSSKVNSATGATHPGVAAFGSNVAVVWTDGGGNIIAQRFDSSGKPLANDQSTPLQDASLGGGQGAPSVAAGTNFFVATWVDTKSGHVRARFLDGAGGFLFNFVNGQNTDFQVSTVDGDTRSNPIAAVGGNNGQYVVIAWEDNTGAPGSFKGIWGRRFPLPSQ